MRARRLSIAGMTWEGDETQETCMNIVPFPSFSGSVEVFFQ
jgi:hypothetical protein